jgi:hypothetical protein
MIFQRYTSFLQEKEFIDKYVGYKGVYPVVWLIFDTEEIETCSSAKPLDVQ